VRHASWSRPGRVALSSAFLSRRERNRYVAGGIAAPRCGRPAPRHGPSSPFRRPTSANEEFAGYIHGSAVKRPTTASASDFDAMTRTEA
jgi:hypothetical protein